jgi:tetratricopeptide (TPR) repeat protein
LALAIVAARIAVHPGFRLADVAAELGGTRAALSVLATGPDADVRTAFSWSYRILSPAAARLFRELAVHPGPEVGVTAVASTAGVREEEARRLLAEIAGAQLIRELRPGRWGCHDLLRAYAVELLAETDGDGARRRATERMVDHYRQTAATVMPILRPEMPPMSYGDRLPGVTPEPLADRDAVLAWYDAEHPVLLPVLRLAYADGLDPYVYELAWGLMSAQDLRGHFRDWIAANELGLAAATRAGRRWWIAVSLLNIARGLFLLEDFESSLAHNRRALPLLAAEGDRQRLAHVHLGSSAAAFGLGRFDLAAEHVAAAAALYREIGDLSGAGWAEYNLGSILSEGPGGAAAALPHMLAGWELHRQAGNVFGEATIGRFIARLRAELGEHAAAVEHLRRSAELFGDFRQPFEQAKTLDRLGTSLVALGRPDAAREAWSRANELVGEDEQPDADRLRRRLKDLIETG